MKSCWRGTLDSPQVLLRSGIGPAAELEALGINVVQDAPQMGRNLHDHFLVPVIVETTAREIAPPRTGVSITQTHMFAKSRPDLEVPDTQPLFSPCRCTTTGWNRSRARRSPCTRAS